MSPGESRSLNKGNYSGAAVFPLPLQGEWIAVVVLSCRRRRESGANWPVRNWSVFWQGNCFKADCACHNRRSTFTMTLSPTREPSGFYAGLKEDLRTPPTAKNTPVVKNFNPKKTPINIQFHTVRIQPVSGRPRHDMHSSRVAARVYPPGCGAIPPR